MIPDLRFAHPWLLLLLPLLPLLLWAARRQRAIGRPPALRYAAVNLLGRSGHTPWRVALLPMPMLLRWIGLALIVIALARPQAGESRQIVAGEGVDIALALDISGSMASLDFEPDNRLAAAKTVIDAFVAARPYDRIGLVVFARDAFAQVPPTVDHNALRRLLRQVELAPQLGLEDGTAIGAGLAMAAAMLKDSPAAARVVILLTDGVNNAGAIDPFTAAQAAAALDIRVHAVGMGRPGQVPFPATNIFGEPTLTYRESALDEAALQQIAEGTGGRYFRADDTDALRRIYAEIDRLEKSPIELVSFSRYQELMVWFLAPALILLTADLALRQTVLRRLP